MTPEHITKVVEIYVGRLEAMEIHPIRMHPSRTFQSLSPSEILMHARHLCETVKEHNGVNQEKTARHLAALQMCLSFAGLYTLDTLMDHNRTENSR